MLKIKFYDVYDKRHPEKIEASFSNPIAAYLYCDTLYQFEINKNPNQSINYFSVKPNERLIYDNFQDMLADKLPIENNERTM